MSVVDAPRSRADVDAPTPAHTWRDRLPRPAAPQLPAAALLVGFAVLVLAWTPIGRVPTAGPDPSWQGALHMAASSGLVWGRDLVFTYGPLGFLQTPGFWTSTTGTLAVLYQVAVGLALATALWSIGRRSFGGLGAALLAIVAIPFVSDRLLAVAMVWTIWLLTAERGRRATMVFAVGMGAL